MKRRGSAMLFVVALVAAMTIAIVATVNVATHALLTQRRIEESERARLYFDGVAQRIVAEYSASTLALPVTKAVLVGSQSTTVTATDNSLNVPHTLKLELSTTLRGRTFSETRVVGARRMPSPFYYALAINNGFTAAGNLTTGSSGSNGDVHARGGITLLGLLNTVNGDLETVATLEITGVSYDNHFTSASAITFPAVSATTYQSAAASTLGTSLNGQTFTISSGGYPILYAPGNLSLRGTFRNKGVIFVNGDVTVSNTMSYFDENSRLAVIATGNVTFSTGSAVGYFYGNALTTPLSGLTISRGGLAFQSATIAGPLTVTNDPAVWLDSEEAVKLRLPGFWP